MKKTDEACLTEIQALPGDFEPAKAIQLEHTSGLASMAAPFDPWTLLLQILSRAPGEIAKFEAWRKGPAGGAYSTPPLGDLNLGVRAGVSLTLTKRG